MICKERLYLTKDRKKVVREGDEHAATLYAAPGDEIPESAVKLFGLKDGGLPAKAAATPPNKEKAPAANKGKKAAPPAQDTPPAPPAQDTPPAPPAGEGGA